ncbi:hypothetical protein [Ohessyouella blattaphilus]|uniref:Uncharacterized protein n=1 Tax=Ohessyouella blattaphilus TaxID=2949333 RepID=A0ABT1EKN3_9FIRM|nr:hypothetical protein [Ohessyouella blattaphilus]MCP1110322.1 hypothetical protein [Ohessyouella blattaphilus]MCR8563716.1 hypothetical protein [Ohessyouella blattaphilus]
MGERAILNRVKKLKELEAQAKAIEAEMEELKAEIKRDMEAKGIEEQQAGDFVVRFKTIIGNRFDSKTFKAEHENLYRAYTKATENRRFSIA